MATEVRAGTYTFKEFCDRIPDGTKADLIDGEIFMASPDNWEANRLSWWLGTLLLLFAQERDLGDVVGSRAAFRLDEGQAPEPDIAFVRKERLHLARRGYFDGPPDVAVEIVSPDSIERDYVRKREQYRSAGVPEYWILDEVEHRTTFLRLDARGRYREVRPRRGEFHSQTITGFWIRPEWLWQSPRPRQSEVLAQILARLNGR